VGTHGVDGEERGPAFIERTVDAGRHWSTVFSAPGDELWWMGRDDASVVVAGAVVRGRDAAGNEIAPLPLLLRSSDGGASFSVTYPELEAETEGSSLWQTTDGGATWTQSWPALPIGPTSGSRPAAPYTTSL
jgi:hypothetical protein